MLKRVIEGIVALAVVLAVLYPIARELGARAAIGRDMINSLDVNDAAALKQWPGSAESFVAMLHERCMSAHGRDSAACVRYRQAGN
jgi:hypothetical protein